MFGLTNLSSGNVANRYVPEKEIFYAELLREVISEQSTTTFVGKDGGELLRKRASMTCSACVNILTDFSNRRLVL